MAGCRPYLFVVHGSPQSKEEGERNQEMLEWIMKNIDPQKSIAKNCLCIDNSNEMTYQLICFPGLTQSIFLRSC